MREHPINDLLNISMDSLVRMVDVGKIIGQPIMIDEKRLIIPISKVAFGFGAGGSEFNNNASVKKKNNYNIEASNDLFPFGGGSGGGISISPSAFLIINDNTITMLKADQPPTLQDKLFDHLMKAFTKDNDK